MSSVVRLRSGSGCVREAHACFKLSEDLCGHIKLSGHDDGVADSARGAEANRVASQRAKFYERRTLYSFLH
jgi:hypothetical protein